MRKVVHPVVALSLLCLSAGVHSTDTVQAQEAEFSHFDKLPFISGSESGSEQEKLSAEGFGPGFPGGPAPAPTPILLTARNEILPADGVPVQGVGYLQVYLNRPVMFAYATVYGARPESLQVKILRDEQAFAQCELSYWEWSKSPGADGSYLAWAHLSGEHEIRGLCDTDLSQPGKQLGAVSAVTGDIVQFSYSDGEGHEVPFYVAELFQGMESPVSIADAASRAQEPTPRINRKKKETKVKPTQKNKRVEKPLKRKKRNGKKL